ncbi:TrmB family transcriptional regulator [bacterium]|nr:TrmB family transcriptional regulator [bacterium]
MDELVEKLKTLGLNSYEAKVYLALLKKYPATGYEVSKIADIPQARAYDTLKALENAQIVTCSSDKPAAYSPIKPKELTKRYKKKIDSTINFLDKKLPNVKDNHVEPIVQVEGYSKIIEKLIESISTAKKQIFIEIYTQDFKYLEKDLLEAYHRGLDIKIVGCGEKFNSNFGTVFLRSNLGIMPNHLAQRYLFAVIDNEEALFGEVNNKYDETNFVITKNHEIVNVLKTFIAHDMYLIDIEQSFPEQLRYFYGNGLKKLRDKVLN